MIGDTRTQPCPRTGPTQPGNPEAHANEMDISFNPRSTPVATPAATQPPDAASAKEAGRAALTVTAARVAGDEAVEAVPESALRRDDALGRLFSAAFTLPPPPMPAFPG